MRIFTSLSTFQEVPKNRTLCIAVAGCPLKCKGCSWKGEHLSKEYTVDDLRKRLDSYKRYPGVVTCVCFLGGEWCSDFVEYLKVCKEKGYKTCLFTGLDKFENQNVLKYLDYLKVGHWDESKGGLSKKTTNQRFIDLKTNEEMNHYFWEV